VDVSDRTQAKRGVGADLSRTLLFRRGGFMEHVGTPETVTVRKGKPPGHYRCRC